MVGGFSVRMTFQEIRGIFISSAAYWVFLIASEMDIANLGLLGVVRQLNTWKINTLCSKNENIPNSLRSSTLNQKGNYLKYN
jgi:hypothetical protein